MFPFPNSMARAGKRALPAFLIMIAVSSLHASPGVGFVTTVRGKAVVGVPGQIPEKVKLHGTYVLDGAAIKTGRKDRMTIVLSNGIGLDVANNTRLTVRDFKQEPFPPDHESQSIEPYFSVVDIQLHAGMVALCTAELRALSQVTVRSESGVLRIHNGRCTLENSEGTLTVAAYEGSFTFSFTDGESRSFLLNDTFTRVGPTSSARGESLDKGPVSDLDPVFNLSSLAARTARDRVYFKSRSDAASKIPAADPVLIVRPQYFEQLPARPYSPID